MEFSNSNSHQKGGGHRFCVDFRALNNITKPLAYPLPLIDEHLRHLKTVFARLKKHGLKIKLSKCQFMKKETKYLGFVIDESGVHPVIDKVEVIRAMPEPRTVREVRGFIGAIGYYRRFIPAFFKDSNTTHSIKKEVCPV